MSKKLLPIVFLSLACLLHLGHSLFPHTHIQEHHHNGKHHHHHHEEHSDENGLAALFFHFSHSSDTFLNSHLEHAVTIVKEMPGALLAFDSNPSYSNSIGIYNKKELVRNKAPLIFISPHLYFFQFRGPPSLIS